MTPCVLLLTCANEEEALKIVNSLLDKKLVSCTKRLPVSSAYLWKNNKESAKEILVVMESSEELFKEVEKEVKKLHSYETFTLFSLPISQTTEAVKDWFSQELKKN